VRVKLGKLRRPDSKMSAMIDRVRIATLIVGALAAGAIAGSARAADDAEAAVLQAVAAVVAEHRIYATCFSLEPMAYQLVRENWAREVKEGTEALRR
jgi:hypothetical protein